MKSKFFAILSIFFLISINITVFAGEPLIKYNYLYLTDPATGLRLPDADSRAVNGLDNQRFKQTSLFKSFGLDPNSPQVGNRDDCYPDNPENPEGNIVLSGRIISNFTNKPVNGAVVAVYMGAEQQGNFTSGFGFNNEKFIHGGKDSKGRLTNLYTYDITKDGYYRVFACNAYKALSETRLDELKKYSPNIFNNPSQPCSADGYTGNSSGCTNFDYTKIYPKFNLSVICGLANTGNSDKPAPQIGEILSIDNYNDEYKSANPPSFMYKNNLDIRVNCGDNLPAFPVPANLDYKSGNVASCRMDDVSPDLRNYYTRVQSNLKNDFIPLERYTAPGSTIIPDDSGLTCSNPDDIFCLKNFLNKSFQKPELGKNIYDYGNKVYLDNSSANPNLINKTLTYNTAKDNMNIDYSDAESEEPNYIARHKSGPDAVKGQLDAKFELKSFISDYQLDLNVLKDLYSCFTTFNAPAVKSNAVLDEDKRNKFVNNTANPNKEFYLNNLRIPTCRELYCGSEFIPDNNICKVKKPDFEDKEKYGFNFSVENNQEAFYQINALSGYGPGVTLNFRSIEEITNDLMVLSKQLIDSDFNPKKSIPGANLLYKPVNKISDIVACLDDNGNAVYLNDGTTQKEGSITYKYETQEKTFFSPVPLMSFISVPYQMKLYNAIEGDNYGNVKKSGPSPILFPEQCNQANIDNATDKSQAFANCRSAVIPGGVYSVSALRVVAKYCNEVFKIPTPDSANLPYANPLTSAKWDSKNNQSPNSLSTEVDLSITKIGTPLSLCLCSVDDVNCNNISKLNNDLTPRDFAVASFVGVGTQNVQNGVAYNVLGAKCNNKQDINNPVDPHRPVGNCQDYLAKRKFNETAAATDVNWKIKNTPEFNYLGSNSNLRTQWNFSWDELPTDEAHKYITYTYTGREPAKSSYRAFSLNSGLWVPATLSNNIRQGTVPCKKGEVETSPGFFNERGDWVPPEITNIKCIDPQGINPNGIGLTRDPYLVSSIFNNKLSPYIAGSATQIPQITKLDQGAGESRNYVSPQVLVYQNVDVGTVGDVQARFRIRNAKYDPIPDLLNDFRRFSVMGVMAGDYCKTPKYANMMDIRVSGFDSNEERGGFGGGANSIANLTAGKHCNTYITDEFDRCDQIVDGKFVNIPQKIIEDARLQNKDPRTLCKLSKCQDFCNQDRLTFKPADSYSEYSYVDVLMKRNTVDSNKFDFFCQNVEPTQGLEFQANKGDEGCILDFVSRMKQTYANPAEIPQGYETVVNDERFSKYNYPVFNNNLCYNPSLDNPLDNRYTFDKENCTRDVFEQTSIFREFQNTGRSIDQNIVP